MSDIVDIYVDGSFTPGGKDVRWGFIVTQNDSVLFQDSGSITGDIVEMYQIGGELQAVIESVKYCKSNNIKCNIYYDYIGIRNWVCVIFNEKPWKCNKKWTKEYRDFILCNKEVINSMIKVKSHSGNKFNEMVDKLIK